jgi:hypothetical protein
MKEWIVELCPEISEWQADMIAEAVYNSVLEEREACAMEADYEAARWPYAPECREPCEEIAKAIRARGEK